MQTIVLVKAPRRYQIELGHRAPTNWTIGGKILSTALAMTEMTTTITIWIKIIKALKRFVLWLQSTVLSCLPSEFFIWISINSMWPCHLQFLLFSETQDHSKWLWVLTFLLLAVTLARFLNQEPCLIQSPSREKQGIWQPMQLGDFQTWLDQYNSSKYGKQWSGTSCCRWRAPGCR